MVRATLAVVLLLCSSVAHAEKRVALVVGNAAYQNASKLLNPGNDAKAIAAMLRAANFDEVAQYADLGIRELRRAIKDFSDLARDADTAVVYSSGHGIEVNGINYLTPTDAVLDRDIDAPYEAYSLDNLLQVLEPARRLRLVMLDACRDNPFARSMKRTIGSRGMGRGLAPVEPTSVNTLIGFAAKAGSIALPGEGANSPYAAALLSNLATPGLDLRIAFGRVRDEVLKVTRNKQEPFVYGSLGGTEIALVSANVPQEVTPATPTRPVVDYDKEMEITFWNAVKDAKSKELLQSYLDRYPAGNFARLAKVLIEQLDKERNATRVEAERDAQGKLAEATRVPTAPVITKETADAAEQAKLIRALQTELKRVGCDPGNVDGVWGDKAKGALAEFTRVAKVTLPSDGPSPDALQAVLGQKGSVCPKQAGADQGASSVAKRSRHETSRPKSVQAPKQDSTKKSNCGYRGFKPGTGA